MTPAVSLETIVGIHGNRLDTHDERFKKQDDALLRIEAKIDKLNEGWNLRIIVAMGASIMGLLGVVWTFVKTAK